MAVTILAGTTIVVAVVVVAVQVGTEVLAVYVDAVLLFRIVKSVFSFFSFSFVVVAILLLVERADVEFVVLVMILV